MSVTLEKLRALKREAGVALATRGAHASGFDGTALRNVGVPHLQAVRAASGVVSDAGTVPTSETGTGIETRSGSASDALASALPSSDRPSRGDDAAFALRGAPIAADAHAPLSGSVDTLNPAAGIVARTADASVARAYPASAVAHAVPAPVQHQLASLRRLLGLRELAPDAPIQRHAPDRRLPGEEIAPGLHYVEVQLPIDAPAAALPLAFARRDSQVDPQHLLFFDTETTGLAGGTGTRAFMIGAADWHAGALRIRQLLIANMAAEAAMLREFATWLSPRTVLTSYNGRSYDAPLLKTRYRLARLPDPLHALDHVDLLHPTRRRYRGRWENCKLATIERELLRIVREDDLPGAQAPAAWLSYLRGGASTLLQRVLAHNHQDVVTLAALMQRLVDAEAADAAARS